MMSIEQPTPEQIRELIKSHGLTRRKAAELIYVSTSTWHKWSAPEGGSDYREMPLAAWELMLLKLGEHPTKKMINKKS